MLKLEPKEADRLLVPSAQLLRDAATGLLAIEDEVRRALALGISDDAVELVDQVVLVETCGLSETEVKNLRTGGDELRGRRVARGTSPRSITL